MRPVPARLPPFAVLTHFTRATGRRTALDNLAEILEARMIRGATRMIRGGVRAVCLFDAPPVELAALLARRNRRRYEPFGVAVDKRYAFLKGARPVIHLPWREAEQMLKPDDMWRVAKIDLAHHPSIDWTFEREWRLAGDLPLVAGQTAALVETWRDAEEIYDRFDGHPPCAGVIPLDGLAGRAP
jgi:hypothetical protein